MKIKDIPEYKDKGEVLQLDEQTSVTDAARKMKAMNYGSTLVTRKGNLAGIFTERDLLMKVVAEGRDINGLKLQDVMTTNLRTTTEEDDVSDCLRRMSQGRFRHMPIVNDNGEILALMSQGDFVAGTWPELFNRLKSKTHTDFINYTQLWMMVVIILAWVTLIPLAISAFE